MIIFFLPQFIFLIFIHIFSLLFVFTSSLFFSLNFPLSSSSLSSFFSLQKYYDHLFPLQLSSFSFIFTLFNPSSIPLSFFLYFPFCLLFLFFPSLKKKKIYNHLSPSQIIFFIFTFIFLLSMRLPFISLFHAFYPLYPISLHSHHFISLPHPSPSLRRPPFLLVA